MRTFCVEPVSGQWNIVNVSTWRLVAQFPTAISAWGHADELEEALRAGCKPLDPSGDCKQLHLSTPSGS